MTYASFKRRAQQSEMQSGLTESPTVHSMCDRVYVVGAPACLCLCASVFSEVLHVCVREGALTFSLATTLTPC